jgi:hypothetical protein
MVSCAIWMKQALVSFSKTSISTRRAYFRAMFLITENPTRLYFIQIALEMILLYLYIVLYSIYEKFS